MRKFALAVFLVIAALPAGAQNRTPLSFLPTPDPNAPPVIDIALRIVRASSGGSSIARSAARGEASAHVYAGFGPCRVGAALEDPAQENSIAWRASGRVRSVERGIAIADVEWQRIDYRQTTIVASPHFRMTLTLPIGERVAVDFVEGTGSACRMDAVVFEIGVAPDNGMRLAMSGEGRPETRSAGARAGGGGGVGAPTAPDQAERQRLGAEAARAASVVTRPMPPREYNVDVWLVPATADARPAPTPTLAQRLSKTIGGTGGRFDFSLTALNVGVNYSAAVEISALVIPIDGERVVVAITRVTTPDGVATPVSTGWIKSVPMPKADAVLSFEIPEQDSPGRVLLKGGLGLRLRIGKAG